MGDEFERIYSQVANLVVHSAARRGVRRPPLRHVSVARVSVLDVPRETLLSIEPDTDFVASSYLVLLDAAPTPQQTRKTVARLRSGELTRTALWEELMATPRFVNSGRKVRFA
jgi:hypothetical protein